MTVFSVRRFFIACTFRLESSEDISSQPLFHAEGAAIQRIIVPAAAICCFHQHTGFDPGAANNLTIGRIQAEITGDLGQDFGAHHVDVRFGNHNGHLITAHGGKGFFQQLPTRLAALLPRILINSREAVSQDFIYNLFPRGKPHLLLIMADAGLHGIHSFIGPMLGCRQLFSTFLFILLARCLEQLFRIAPGSLDGAPGLAFSVFQDFLLQFFFLIGHRVLSLSLLAAWSLAGEFDPDGLLDHLFE
jgi:hypothetical protein